MVLCNDDGGVQVSGQFKNLQVVASLTAERDGDIRKAAINTLATGYKILGDDIWRHLGKLTDAQRSMIDEKFKIKAREMDKKREGRPGDARAALIRRSVRDNGSEIAEQSGEVARDLPGPVFVRESYPHTALNMERNMFPRPIVGVAGPTDWNEALDIISYGSPEQSVEGMKVVCHDLAQPTNDPEGSAMDDIFKDADRLVSCLANKVATTFDFSLTGASSRSCKYVLNTLMQTFQKSVRDNIAPDRKAIRDAVYIRKCFVVHKKSVRANIAPDRKDESNDRRPPQSYRRGGLQGIPWKDFSSGGFSLGKKDPSVGKGPNRSRPVKPANSARKSRRVLKKAFDDDDKIRYLEKLKNSRLFSISREDEEDTGKNHKRMSNFSGKSDDLNEIKHSDRPLWAVTWQILTFNACSIWASKLLT